MSTAVATEFPARMYIDGAWCDAMEGGTLGGHQSGRRIGPGRGRLWRAGRRRAGDQGGRAGLSRMASGLCLRSRQDLEEDRRADARPCRPNRPRP